MHHKRLTLEDIFLKLTEENAAEDLGKDEADDGDYTPVFGESSEDENNEDFKLLWQLLKMDLIPPDEVHLMPDLFSKNR